MAFDLGEEALVDVGAFTEFFQDGDLLLEAFVGGIHAIEEVGHISKHDGIETNTNKHPHDRKQSLLHVFAVYIAEADRGEGLEGPVKRLEILHGDVSIYNTRSRDPAVTWETHLFR